MQNISYKDVTITEVSKLNASDGESNDYFGRAVAITPDGLNAIVGAHGKNTSKGVNVGQVYTYNRKTVKDPWVEINTIQVSNGEPYIWFGSSVAISDDGLVAMVGAYDKTYKNSKSSGQVYTYKRKSTTSSWVEVNTLRANNEEALIRFGISVAMTSDGLVAMVGAIYEKYLNLPNTGQVYTYKRDSIDDEWVEVSKLIASDASAFDHFGISISMTSDGLMAMVGASGKNFMCKDEGQVYTYRRKSINDEWMEVNKLQAKNSICDNQFGVSVALVSNGLLAFVGAPGYNSYSGHVYVYKLNTENDAWEEISIIHTKYAIPSSYYGISIAIAHESNTVLIGASGKNISSGTHAGQVYDYKLYID